MTESSITFVTLWSIPNLTSFAPAKLSEHNYIAWVFQVRPTLRTHGLLGIADGSEPCPLKFLPAIEDKDVVINPAFLLWERKDQYILSWFITTLSKKVILTVYGLNTSHEVWTALAKRYASTSKSRINQLQRQLQTIHQGTQTCSEFIQEAKSFADELALSGKKIDEEDLISHLNGGLNPRFNAFITTISILMSDKAIPFKKFQAELLSQEHLIQQQESHIEKGSFALYSNRSNPRKAKFSNNNGSRTPQYNGSRTP